MRFRCRKRRASERFEWQRFRPRQRLHGSTRADPAPDARDRKKPARPSARKVGRPEPARSEERRVGKSVDLGGRRIIKKKKKESDRFKIGRIAITSSPSTSWTTA